MLKLVEKQQWYCWTNTLVDEVVHAFPNDFCPKVNVVAWFEFELAYSETTAQAL